MNAFKLEYNIDDEYKQLNNDIIKLIPHRHPFLLIDDEADNASINTAYGKGQVTKINSQIRKRIPKKPNSTLKNLKSSFWVLSRNFSLLSKSVYRNRTN